MITVYCLHCKKEFRAHKRDTNRGRAIYCSSRCCGAFRKGKLLKPRDPNSECAYCAIKFYRHKTHKSKSGLYFCCRAHKDFAQRIGGVKEIMPSHYGAGSSTGSYRSHAFRAYGKKCTMCGFDDIRAIQVHHMDEDRSNNSIDNLAVLCANCHCIQHRT